MNRPSGEPAGASTVFDLHVRGEIPRLLGGSLVVTTNRRNKERGVFSRWHDSQTDLMRLDLSPGHPGRIRAHVLAVDPSGVDLGEAFPDGEQERRTYGRLPAYGYATQPNHGINIAGNTIWATNLLFGAPLEVDLPTLRPKRILRYVELNEMAPRVSSTAHFAWSLDHCKAYFHQSLLQCESPGLPVRAAALQLIELDVQSGGARTWELLPPPEDADLATANFHSSFYFEENGKEHIGLLRTGALLEGLAPHTAPVDHTVLPASPSTIWIVELDHTRPALQAQLLSGIRELDGLALSHLDVDASGGDGFILYANFKEADVAEETHGENIFGEAPAEVREHYSGMGVEPLNTGLVLRYERRGGQTSVRTFRRGYDPKRTSQGHTWLPINIALEPTRRRFFGTFAGFRPRLLPQHVARAYSGRAVDPQAAGFVPPLLMRFDAATLEPDFDSRRGHLSYAEPIAMTVAGEGAQTFVCTFSPERGLRVYRTDDLSQMVCQAESPDLMYWQDTHFRPEPAHMQFAPR